MPWLLLLLVFQPAFAGKRSRKVVPRPPPDKPLVEVRAEVDRPVTVGSLWHENESRKLAGMDSNSRKVGDLVTIVIEEQTMTSLNAGTETANTSKTSAGISALLGAETSIPTANQAMGGKISIDTSRASDFRGSGTTNRNATLQSIITCEVIDVLPTGNLRLWGRKQIRVNREIQWVVIDGLVRPRDISIENIVSSSMLAKATIEVTGSGVINDKQGPGLFQRVLDAVWPF
jgi:flagellar L-ring protein precursor FlgH